MASEPRPGDESGRDLPAETARPDAALADVPLPQDLHRSSRLRRVQDELLHLMGSTIERRAALVAAMLHRNPNEVASYWLQLVVSVGIATLGLVVGSTAVIIGAMLVAPLMGPIIALAMGLATGSPFMVLRSAARIVLSVVVAIGGAALITLLLPFHDLNAEIAARTSPTVLDLLTAGFCAMAGVYASLRPGSDTATTAAGTSIGISLVPPLCASGYGLGSMSLSVAGGAALLFLTNLVAIIFIGTLSFVAAGFDRVDAAALERDELAKGPKAVITAAIARRMAGLFESKAGPALRFAMPLVLLAVVYVPLRQALDEVAWEVRVRAAVQASLGREPHRIVQSRVRVERQEVDVRVVLLGNTGDAEASRQRLMTEVERGAGVVPHIEVLAIPDATAFAGLESTLRSSRDPLPVVVAPPAPSKAEQLDRAADLVRAAVLGLWPEAAAGAAVEIEVGVVEDGVMPLRVVHVGPALGADASESLVRGVSAALGVPVRLVDVAVPGEILRRDGGDLAFVSRVTAGVRATAAAVGVHVCVAEPPVVRGKKRPEDRDQELAATLRALLATHPRVTWAPGEAWSVQFLAGTCPSPAAVDAAPEGAAGASASGR